MFSSGSPQGEMGLDLEVGKDLMRVLEGFFGFVEEWEEEIKETTMSLRMKGVVPRHKGRRGKSSYMVVEDPFIRNRVSDVSSVVRSRVAWATDRSLLSWFRRVGRIRLEA